MVIAAIVMAGLLWGCIENPGPDNRLGEENNRLSAIVRGENREILELKARQRSGRIFLEATNVAPWDLDSATFLIALGMGREESHINPVIASPLLVHYGSTGRLFRGQSLYLGDIAPALESNLSDLNAQAYLIRASRDGSAINHSLSGVYHGAYAGRNSGSTRFYSGSLRAYIDVDGMFGFSLEWHGKGSDTISLSGLVEGRIEKDSTAFAGVFTSTLHYHRTEDQPPGKFRRKGSGFEVDFRFGSGKTWTDSIRFILEPDSPVSSLNSPHY
ncbi:MAG TPA: hypothetical protein VJ385_20695 [Fibrobacteria bacterium]|nr:hypothetical protein [Fibrobacteria bacterium]